MLLEVVINAGKLASRRMRNLRALTFQVPELPANRQRDGCMQPRDVLQNSVLEKSSAVELWVRCIQSLERQFLGL
jgi:hypothetical protein